MDQLLIATKNAGKFTEISEVLHGLPIQLVSLRDLNLDDEVEEVGVTHEGNAILKARYFYSKTKLPTLGEDSGIDVDAFPGELGVQTRRWGGLAKATDEEWVKVFLEKMKAFPSNKKGAEFVCYAALIVDEKSYAKPHVFFGKTRGVITNKLEAPIKTGIPISSCFKPEGFDKVYAALSVQEKNSVSHRGKAISEARRFLLKNLV